MKGLCPECGKFHTVTAGCYSLLIKADAYRDENERFAKERRQWDEWYVSLPPRLKSRLSLEDFKLLGDLFKQAFKV